MATKAATKITPLADRVVVLPIEDAEEMRGGLYIPDTAKEKPQQGEIVAVGPGKLSDEGVGETDLLVPTADGVVEPKNRRVTVTIN